LLDSFISLQKTKNKENILEITLDGKYKEAEDGTKVIIEPGTTRTYIIYTKQ